MSNIIVVGDVMLDIETNVFIDRISPEAPVPVAEYLNTNVFPGGAANVASSISELSEEKPTLIGITGNDDNSIKLHKLCDGRINFINLNCDTAPTISKNRIKAKNHQILRIDNEKKFHGHDDLYQRFCDVLSDNCIVVLSDYGKGTLIEIEKFIEKAQHNSAKVLIDPKGEDFTKYRNAFLLKPNKKEFELICGTYSSEAEFESLAINMCQELNLGYLLITLGSDGMALFSKSGLELRIRTEATEVFDVTGAGDTVLATIAYGLSRGKSINASVLLANKAAGIVVKKHGTANVTRKELEIAGTTKVYGGSAEFLKHDSKILDGKKVVFTNGCFDILHNGHADFLREAKSLGDLLIVGLNSDKSISRIKGRSRPVNDFEKRSSLLSHLPYVDVIIQFDQDTPYKLIECIRPDILVKGDDYCLDKIVGKDIIDSYGGSTVTIPISENISTSKIINRILSLNG